MPRVLILATTTGYQTRAFGDAARRLGVELVFATDRCDMLDDPWWDEALPIRFYDEQTSVRTILDFAVRQPLDGVVAVGDRPTAVAARVLDALALPGHSSDAVAAARHKPTTRERLRTRGLAVPAFLEAPADTPADWFLQAIRFPAVVKPVALSGSRGVMRVDDPDELRAALARLRSLLASPDVRAERDPAHETVLVEEFIEGQEYAVEGLIEHGRLHVLAIFDKPDPLNGPFFEETIYVTPSRAGEETRRAIAHTVAQATAALGLFHGPVHAECRLNARGVVVLEVAARPIGGLCARSLRFRARRPGTSSAGQTPSKTSGTDCGPEITFEELLLRHALGESVGNWQREPSASGVMMIPIPERGILRGVAGVEEARAVPCIDDIRITAKPDQLLIPLPEGASYLGFIFARAPQASVVEHALRSANQRLTFVITPEIRVLQSTHG